MRCYKSRKTQKISSLFHTLLCLFQVSSLFYTLHILITTMLHSKCYQWRVAKCSWQGKSTSELQDRTAGIGENRKSIRNVLKSYGQFLNSQPNCTTCQFNSDRYLKIIDVIVMLSNLFKQKLLTQQEHFGIFYCLQWANYSIKRIAFLSNSFPLRVLKI